MAKKPQSVKPSRTASAPGKAAVAKRSAAVMHKKPAGAAASIKKVSKAAAATATSAKAAAAPPAEKRAPKPQPATLEEQIKALDAEILRAVNKRAELTTKQIESLPSPQQAVFDPHADDALWATVESSNPGPLPIAAVRGIFRQILSAARRQVKTVRVAYLGPRFSFTHLAAIERFGESADLIPVSTIGSVFEEVNRGHANYGIVPIENSTDGRVVDTLDMFTRLPLRICGEVQIAVHHNLLARCPRSEVTEIYSKPQALSQCRDWLAKNMPHTKLIDVTSTSTAAQLARDKPGAAAVASQRAAVEYDLQILAENIEDNKNNVTRFAVIGDEASRPTGRDRTAMLLQIPHEPGSLGDALGSFKKHKINLTWIESFPLRGPEVGYLFFLDFEGHVDDQKTKKALEELNKRAVRMEVLGSYPRSDAVD